MRSTLHVASCLLALTTFAFEVQAVTCSDAVKRLLDLNDVGTVRDSVRVSCNGPALYDSFAALAATVRQTSPYTIKLQPPADHPSLTLKTSVLTEQGVPARVMMEAMYKASAEAQEVSTAYALHRYVSGELSLVQRNITADDPVKWISPEVCRALGIGQLANRGTPMFLFLSALSYQLLQVPHGRIVELKLMTVTNREMLDQLRTAYATWRQAHPTAPFTDQIASDFIMRAAAFGYVVTTLDMLGRRPLRVTVPRLADFETSLRTPNGNYFDFWIEAGPQ